MYFERKLSLSDSNIMLNALLLQVKSSCMHLYNGEWLLSTEAHETQSMDNAEVVLEFFWTLLHFWIQILFVL
jgi:hypothetical protein